MEPKDWNDLIDSVTELRAVKFTQADIDAAVAAEREACAMVCEAESDGHRDGFELYGMGAESNQRRFVDFYEGYKAATSRGTEMGNSDSEKVCVLMRNAWRILEDGPDASDKHRAEDMLNEALTLARKVCKDGGL